MNVFLSENGVTLDLKTGDFVEIVKVFCREITDTVAELELERLKEESILLEWDILEQTIKALELKATFLYNSMPILSKMGLNITLVIKNPLLKSARQALLSYKGFRDDILERGINEDFPVKDKKIFSEIDWTERNGMSIKG